MADMDKVAFETFDRFVADHHSTIYSLERLQQYFEMLTALGYSLAGPDEVVVPREPTEAMVRAAQESLFRTTPDEAEDDLWTGICRAMLAAAEEK